MSEFLFTTSGTQNIWSLSAENANNVSTMLTTGFWSQFAAAAKLHQSDQQFAYRAVLPGVRVAGSDDMSSASYGISSPTKVSAYPSRIRSTSHINTAHTLVMPDAQMSGQSGHSGQSFGSFNTTEDLLQNLVMANLKTHISAVAAEAEKRMFEGIFGITSVTTQPSNAMAGLTYTDKNYTTDVTRSHTQLADFTSNTLNPDQIAFQFVADLEATLCKADNYHMSLATANKRIALLMPRTYLGTVRNYLSAIRANDGRQNVGMSDGTFEYINLSSTTYNGMLLIGLPDHWFYTTGSDAATRAMIGVMMTYEAYVPYCPLQQENILQLGMDIIHPRALSLKSKLANMSFESWVTEESRSGYGALSAEDLVGLTDSYHDKTLLAMARAHDRLHPENKMVGRLGNAYSPLSYKVYMSNMPSTSSSITSFGTTMEVTRWAGGIRVMPGEMSSFIMPCSLYPTDLSARNRPIVTSFTAMQTMPKERLERWFYENKDEVRKEIEHNKKKLAEHKSSDQSLESMIDEQLKELGTNFRAIESKKVKQNATPESITAMDAMEADVKRVIAKAKSAKDLRGLSTTGSDHGQGHGV